MSTTYATKKNEIADIIDSTEESYKGQNDYLKKTIGLAMVLDGHAMLFEKPRIETRFCFGEHGYDYDEVNATCDRLSRDEEYFKQENMRGINNKIQIIDERKNIDSRYEVLISTRNGKIGCHFVRNCESDHYGLDIDEYLAKLHRFKNYGENDCWKLRETSETSYRFATDGECEAIRQAYAIIAEKFDKRLNTYLKRYGLSKCDFWTYWADR